MGVVRIVSMEESGLVRLGRAVDVAVSRKDVEVCSGVEVLCRGEKFLEQEFETSLATCAKEHSLVEVMKMLLRSHL